MKDLWGEDSPLPQRKNNQIANTRWHKEHPEVHRKSNRRWREVHPEKARENSRQWSQSHPERHRENTNRWREAHPEKVREVAHKADTKYRESHQEELLQKQRDKNLKRYRLTRLQVEEMIDSQNNCCSLCGLPFVRDQGLKKLSPVVDHNHENGRNRAILHSECNLLLGVAHDSEIRLRQATQYLRRHASNDELLETAIEG